MANKPKVKQPRRSSPCPTSCPESSHDDDDDDNIRSCPIPPPPPPVPCHSRRVVQIQTPTVPLRAREVYITCPHCHVRRLTRIELEPTCKTHLVAACLCLVGCWCCVCMPYLVESCVNVKHYCGNCNYYLGTYTNNGAI